MLGNQAGEDKGKVTGERVLDPNGPIELSFPASGKYWNRRHQYGCLLVYSTSCKCLVWRRKGCVNAQKQHGFIIMDGTRDGKFHRTGKSKIPWLSILQEILNRQLSTLDNLVGVFEYELDASGNTASKVLEWK